MEIVNIGTDIEDVSRFENLEKKVLERLFTPKEIKYCFSKKNVAQHLAARYSAKEAVFKALPFDEIAFKKIEISNSKSGAPQVTVQDERAKDLCFKISLSHTKNLVQATVLIYKK